MLVESSFQSIFPLFSLFFYICLQIRKKNQHFLEGGGRAPWAPLNPPLHSRRRMGTLNGGPGRKNGGEFTPHASLSSEH